jgi:lipoprotein-releasing system permease protein
MFYPLEWFIGLRYLRPLRRRGIVSFMTAASLVGIALGVAALIVILSVMNGLEAETRTRLLRMSAHATVSMPGGITERASVDARDAWREAAARLSATPGVVGATPYVLLEGMLAAGVNLRPAIVRGILPEEEASTFDIERFLQHGALEALEPGMHRIILGRVLALNLGLSLGDSVRLLVPTVTNGEIEPRLATFVVAGIFEAGIQEHDGNLALVHLSDASQLKGLRGAAEGLAARLDDPMNVNAFRRDAIAVFGSEFKYSDWSQDHRNLFTAIRIEKVMMTIILMFIVGVAAFNIVASLMMVVIDKEKDIAILRTCGLEPRRVARVFVVQGSVIGLVGTVLGTALGLVLAFNVDVILPWLEDTFNFQVMPGDVYYVTQLPSEVHLFDVVAIPVVAFLVAVAATVYPSRRAAAVAPAAALRYD